MSQQIKTKITHSFKEYLQIVRRFMTQHQIDFLWVRSTDQFLNEYVPNQESLRVFLSGFDGSTGDLLIGLKQAYVLVDGRYVLQAKTQVDSAVYSVVCVSMEQRLEDCLLDLIQTEGSRTPLILACEIEKMTAMQFKSLTDKCAKRSIILQAKDLITASLYADLSFLPDPVWHLVQEVSSLTMTQHVSTHVLSLLKKQGIDAYWCQTLDEIAYVTSLRGQDFAYQSTFRASALLCANKIYLVSDYLSKNLSMSKSLMRNLKSRGVVLCACLADVVAQLPASVRFIGFDSKQTTLSMQQAWQLQSQSMNRVFEWIDIKSPIAPVKAIKTNFEQRLYKRALKQADTVFMQAQKFLCQSVGAGKKISEVDFSDYVYHLFIKSGACGLSFKTICAFGKNGAQIHYGSPSARRFAKSGELVLLDAGAFYDGYATDLTRTFLAGSAKCVANQLQKKIFTSVLRSAIAGMSAVFPVHANGHILDTLTRAPLWQQGLDFAHGTGHGVGISVHESPPRISVRSDTRLSEGMLFSIEPGYYDPQFGGVRIENLCTVKYLDKTKRYWQVVPLTFAPLDGRLIDKTMLTKHEQQFLAKYYSCRII